MSFICFSHTVNECIAHAKPSTAGSDTNDVTINEAMTGFAMRRQETAKSNSTYGVLRDHRAKFKRKQWRNPFKRREEGTKKKRERHAPMC